MPKGTEWGQSAGKTRLRPKGLCRGTLRDYTPRSALVAEMI